MPRRRRSDAEAEAEAAADCCGGGGGSVERRKKPRDLASGDASARETFPVEWVVYFFLVEIAGKRAAILVLVGCQRVHDFGPGKTGTGEAGPEKRPGSSRGSGAAKGGLSD